MYYFKIFVAADDDVAITAAVCVVDVSTFVHKKTL